MTQKEYIIGVALTAFNKQFGGSYKIKDFDCFSLVSPVRDRCLFEIYTRRNFDYLRLRLSCELTNTTQTDRYKLVVAIPTIIRGLGDEVWYANALLDHKTLYPGLPNLRRTCPYIPAAANVTLATEDLTGILTEDGDEILISD